MDWDSMILRTDPLLLANESSPNILVLVSISRLDIRPPQSRQAVLGFRIWPWIYFSHGNPPPSTPTSLSALFNLDLKHWKVDTCKFPKLMNVGGESYRTEHEKANLPLLKQRVHSQRASKQHNDLFDNPIESASVELRQGKVNWGPIPVHVSD